MRVLITGAGVIGTAYGAHLGAAGHTVSVLRHPPRTDDIANRGLAARDVLNGSRAETAAVVVPDAATGLYDRVARTTAATSLTPARMVGSGVWA
jgi:ketopantoate reductase